MTNEEFQAIVDRYLDGVATPAEEKLLNAYYDDRIQRRPGIASWSEQEKETAKAQLRGRLNTHIHRTDPHASGRSGTWMRWAASFALLIGVGLGTFFLTQSATEEIRYISKSTIRGQKSTIVLSDGTRVRLNSESNIRYPEQFSGEVRDITLQGEAFFEVTKDPSRPFIVLSGETRTTVLGTSFNINAYTEREVIAVTVATGKVQVANDSDPSSAVALFPGMQATYHKPSKSIRQQEVDLERFLAWKDNRITFEDITLGEAISILNRWFDTDIQLECKALGTCDIQGTFENETLTNILESIKFVKGIDYQLLGNNKILITGDNCR